ncbi:MAG TPA: hypothetical protein DCL60_00135 [Armatimonadetes bacterium]|nr:hypothetical protein [Armatimonadota bacterium]
MLRKALVAGSVMLFAAGICSVRAAALPTEAFSYKADFETVDPVKYWVGSKEYTINFKGLTDEKCVEGKKCLKMDVTLGGGLPYVYWNIPMPKRIPAEGTLKFTGNAFLGAETTANRVEIGPSYSYPPSTVGGTCPSMFVANAKNKDKWQPMQGDLVKIGGTTNVANYDWGNPTLANTGVYLDFIIVRFFGKKGDRVVLYLDDFKVEGQVPVAAKYSKAISARWAPIKDKVDARASEFESALAKNAQDISNITPETADGEKLKKDLLQQISALQARVKTIKSKGNMRIKDVQGIESGIKSIEESKSNL